MTLHQIIDDIKDVLKDDFIAIKTGTWNDTLHIIHIEANRCTFYQSMELTRVTGDLNLLFFNDPNNHLEIVANLKTIT